MDDRYKISEQRDKDIPIQKILSQVSKDNLNRICRENGWRIRAK